MGDIFLPRSLQDLAATFPPELEHISASGMKMLVRCEEQWRQRYLLGKVIPPNLNLIGGNADHAAIEMSMVQKIETHVDLPVGEVRERFVATVEEKVEEAGGVGELEFREGEDLPSKIKQLDELRSDGQRLVAAYHVGVSPRLQPLKVEERFTIEVPGVPVDVIGYTDLIAVEAQRTLWQEEGPAEPRIIDRKRSGRAKAKPEPEWRLQADIYQLAVPLPHDWHISVTNKTPKIQLPENVASLTNPVAPRERSERTLQMLVKKLGWLYMTFGPDEPWPASGKLHPWACGYCGFREGCWAWQD